MKITAGQLRQLIREEIEVLNEADITDEPFTIGNDTINFHRGQNKVTVNGQDLKLFADFSVFGSKYKPLKINKVVGSPNNIKGMQMSPKFPIPVTFDNKGFRKNVLPAIKDALAKGEGERAKGPYGVKAVKV